MKTTIFLTGLILGSTFAMADGSSVSVTPHELRAQTDRASAVVRNDQVSARIHRPSQGRSKIEVNENTNLGIVNKSDVDGSTIGMSIRTQ